MIFLELRHKGKLMIYVKIYELNQWTTEMNNNIPELGVGGRIILRWFLGT
jgi:hypothetical protein